MAGMCIDPDKVREGDLLAYLEGTATADLAAHIRQCPACAAELSGLRQADALLTSALYRASCPETDTLLQYQAGLLSASEQRRVAQHIAGCAQCRRELATLELPDTAPPSLLERVAEAGKRLLRGVLVSAGPQPALALRGAAPQQLAYQADDYQLLLALTPPLLAAAVWRLEGQLMRADPASAPLDAPVLLRNADTVVAQDRVDAFGYFAFEQIPPGTYTLQIDLPDAQILIEALELL